MTAPQLHYYDIDDGITAFSSTRQGGVSDGDYAQFNINEYCGDDPEHIAVNRKALCHTLGIKEEALIVPHQVHGTEIRQIGRELLTMPDEVRRIILDGVDGVMTDVQGVCVGVSTADCIPVLLYDTRHHAVCAVHAGWRGTLQRIVQKAIAMMRASYSTVSSDIKAIIGPGISLDAFEVGQEVYDAFKEAAFDMTKIAEMRDKWHIDLPQCNRIQLMEAGVSEQNILSSGICTYSSSSEYFSARRLGINSGRIYNGIMIK